MIISEYLKEKMKENKYLRILVNQTLNLKWKDLDAFFLEFGTMNEDEMAKFIIDMSNSYKIGKWSNGQIVRYGGNSKDPNVISRPGQRSGRPDKRIIDKDRDEER